MRDEISQECPFDFMRQFNSWFAYQRDRRLHKLTHEQACLNVRMENCGWSLLDGMPYGGWQRPVFATETKESE